MGIHRVALNVPHTFKVKEVTGGELEECFCSGIGVYNYMPFEVEAITVVEWISGKETYKKSETSTQDR